MISCFQKKSIATAEKLAEIKIVPVLVLNSVEEGLKVGEILVSEGLPAAEITFRTAAAESIIKAMSEKFPELYIGAGTVLNTDDLKRAFDAGAKFAVAPGFNPTVVKSAIENSYSFAPGICTPSEVEQAYELGCKFLKFFPAEAAGGISMLKSVIAPYKHLGIKFMPTGGVSEANANDYLSIPEVAAVGGTWLGKPTDIVEEKWDAIREKVRQAVFNSRK